MKTTITADIEIRFTYDEKLAYVLSVEMPTGYVPGDDGEIYLNEHDGTRFASLWPALAPLFPKGSTPDSDGKNEAWVSHGSGEKLAEFNGKFFTVRLTQETDEGGEFSEIAKLASPWSLDDEAPLVVIDKEKSYVADCGVSIFLQPAEQTANARLIASAPDLLAALEDLIRDVADIPDIVDRRPLLAAYAAIAKARGGAA